MDFWVCFFHQCNGSVALRDLILKRPRPAVLHTVQKSRSEVNTQICLMMTYDQRDDWFSDLNLIFKSSLGWKSAHPDIHQPTFGEFYAQQFAHQTSLGEK